MDLCHNVAPKGPFLKLHYYCPSLPKISPSMKQLNFYPFLIVLLKAFRNELRYLQLFSIFRDHKVAIDYCNGVIGLKNTLLRH